MAPVISKGAIVCSTPFGIRGTNTGTSSAITGTLATCSTPFGIRGTNTSLGYAHSTGRESCSTPCGIRGTNTTCTRRSQRLARSAQRLAASEGRTPPGSGTAGDTDTCSTPCGIRATNTRVRLAGYEKRATAQRLAASEGRTHRRAGSASTTSPAAQRLAASEGRTLDLATLGHPSDLLLNALRHQRDEHPNDPTGKAEREFCSTPCGIRGTNTCRSGRTPAFHVAAQRLAASEGRTLEPVGDLVVHHLALLNALRHQRDEHVSGAITDPCYEDCSTPCGIRGTNTRGRGFVMPGERSAQRLAASEGRTHTRGLAELGLQVGLLNALRHQRDEHAVWIVIGVIAWLCSTPCGIRGTNSTLVAF